MVCHQKGFTLVEMSIVLVVVGMLIGGVLVGKDMIQAAEERAAIADITKLQTAYTHFQDKFDCIVGDCANATDYFRDPYWALENGDGNGLIECGASPPTAACPAPTSEQVMALIELTLAGFISRQSEEVPESMTTELGGCHMTLHRLLSTWPDLYGQPTANYIWVTKTLTAMPWRDDCLTPENAYNLDNKIDDGFASTGRVRGRQYYGTDYTECADQDWSAGVQMGGRYNVDKTNVECSLFIQFE